MRRVQGLIVTLTIVAVISAATASVVRAENQHPLEALCSSIQQQASESGAYVGFVILDLIDDTRCAANASESFRTASLYKLFVLAEAYEQIAAGSFSLDELITIEARHWVDDPAFLRQTEPIEFTAAEALRRMIIFSENASALALYERLEPEAVAQVPSRLGLSGTTLAGAFVTTPSDVAALFSALYRGDIVSPEASGEMLALLLDQRINDLIPLSLPEGTTVAHKTGLVEKYLHDAGIVFAPGGDYVTVLLTRWDDDIDDSYDAIHDLAGLAYGAFAQQFDRSLQPVLATPGEPGILDQALAVPQVAVAPAAVNLESADRPVAAPAPRLVAPSGLWWQRIELQASALAVLVGLLAVTLLRRRALPGAIPPLTPQPAYARVDPRPVMAEVEVSMRFGSRSRGDGEPAQPEATDDARQPAQSQRIQRLVQYFSAQTELLSEMRAQVDEEVSPILDLLQKQELTMQQLLLNLDRQLEPLNEYATSEEANLRSLEQQLAGEESEFVASQFHTYLAQQRARIDETRQRIEDQRAPFVAFGDDQRETVEVALSRFDVDIDALEQNLAEQRKVMMRMLDAMRSESFSTLRSFLADREIELAELVQGGSAHPGRIGDLLHHMGDSLRTQDDQHVTATLAASDLADERLREAAPATPVAFTPPEPAEEAEEAVEAEELTSA